MDTIRHIFGIGRGSNDSYMLELGGGDGLPAGYRVSVTGHESSLYGDFAASEGRHVSDGVYMHSLSLSSQRSRFTLVLRLLGVFLLLTCGGMSLSAQEPQVVEPQVVADTLVEVELPDINVYARRNLQPLTLEERQQLWRLIRDVKKTYPYAKYVAATIIETYEYMETLPEKERERHLKQVEKEPKRDMTPKMKDLTLRQGKVLIKLIHRQCGMTGYELVQAFLGSFKAWTWQIFARITGANLKSPYDPLHNQEDAVIERIIQLSEHHLL